MVLCRTAHQLYLYPTPKHATPCDACLLTVCLMPQAVCLGRCEAASGLPSDVWELSTRDSMRAAVAEGKSFKNMIHAASRMRGLKAGATVDGYACEPVAS